MGVGKMLNNGREKRSKNVLAVVKKLVEIKKSLYLCIPMSVVKKCGLSPGDRAAIIAGTKILTVVFPEPESSSPDSPFKS
jgi:hypothetical protein